MSLHLNLANSLTITLHFCKLISRYTSINQNTFRTILILHLASVHGRFRVKIVCGWKATGQSGWFWLKSAFCCNRNEKGFGETWRSKTILLSKLCCERISEPRSNNRESTTVIWEYEWHSAFSHGYHTTHTTQHWHNWPTPSKQSHEWMNSMWSFGASKDLAKC